MSKALELREKRARLWETAKNFLDSKRGTDGLVSPEDAATYDRMEADMVSLGKEIERLERQSAYDAEMARATSVPLNGRPGEGETTSINAQEKTGRAAAEYRRAFWNVMRTRGGEGLETSMEERGHGRRTRRGDCDCRVV